MVIGASSEQRFMARSRKYLSQASEFRRADRPTCPNAITTAETKIGIRISGSNAAGQARRCAPSGSGLSAEGFLMAVSRHELRSWSEQLARNQIGGFSE
jgi:hypothetical protein